MTACKHILLWVGISFQPNVGGGRTFNSPHGGKLVAKTILWVNFEFQLDELCGCDYEELVNGWERVAGPLSHEHTKMRTSQSQVENPENLQS